MPYTLIFGLGASTWPKLAPGPRPQSPEPRRELVFNLGAGTWPKASEPQARAGELALGLPPAQGSEAPGQVPNQKNQKNQKNKKKQKKQKSKETKKLDF